MRSRFLVVADFAIVGGATVLASRPIGVDEDTFAAGYNATDEFSSENRINDARPGTVYTANNLVVDDDFQRGCDSRFVRQR